MLKLNGCLRYLVNDNDKQGTNVIWDFYLLHRDPDLWGDDAEQYRPERFESRRGTKGYLPFNAGPVSVSRDGAGSKLTFSDG